MTATNTFTAIETAQERARNLAVARFLLAAADDLGVRVGTNGDDLVTVTTTRVPVATITALERELVKPKRAVIAAIMLENAARQEASS